VLPFFLVPPSFVSVRSGVSGLDFISVLGAGSALALLLLSAPAGLGIITWFLILGLGLFLTLPRSHRGVVQLVVEVLCFGRVTRESLLLLGCQILALVIRDSHPLHPIISPYVGSVSAALVGRFDPILVENI